VEAYANEQTGSTEADERHRARPRLWLACPAVACTHRGGDGTFRDARDLISTKVTDVIVAETGADMSRFPTAGHLASWPVFVQVPTNLQAT
jgi:hypothetical protein